MYNDQRRGDSWKLNDLRALLFEHYARECKATSKPLAVEGFSRQSVKTKLQKMKKVPDAAARQATGARCSLHVTKLAGER